MKNEQHVQGKRIAFILYNYPLLVSTMVVNSIALLSKENDVEVITVDRTIDPATCDPWLQKMIVTPPACIYSSLPARLIINIGYRLSRFVPDRFARIRWYLNQTGLVLFSFWLKRRCRSQAYDIIIPVECLSLIAVTSAGIRRGDVIYFNLELLDWSKEPHPLYKNKSTLKELEYEALKEVTHVMITSPERARIFCGINRFPDDRVSVLPVLPLHRESLPRSRYFRDRFSIPDHALLALYAGNFMPWAMCLEIIEGMNTWPEDTVLVMHTWNRTALSGDYFRKMQRAAEGHPVFFSSDLLCHQDLAPALSSGDIGLLFYESLDANFTEILFSSNKMAEYVDAGLPVICSAFPSLQGFVTEHGIGRSVDISDIGKALIQIREDMEKYRRNVDRCRRLHFEFDPYFKTAFSEYLAHGVRGS